MQVCPPVRRENRGSIRKAPRSPSLIAPRENIARPNRDDQQNAERTEQIHRRVINRPDSHHYERSAPQFVAHFVEARVLFALAHETLDLANARKIVVQEEFMADAARRCSR